MRRARPHMLEIGDADARAFIFAQELAADPSSDPSDPDPSDCLTPQIEHLYDNPAALVRAAPHDSPRRRRRRQLPRPAPARRPETVRLRSAGAASGHAGAGDEEGVQRAHRRSGGAGRGNGDGGLLPVRRRCRGGRPPPGGGNAGARHELRQRHAPARGRTLSEVRRVPEGVSALTPTHGLARAPAERLSASSYGPPGPWRRSSGPPSASRSRCAPMIRCCSADRRCR